MPKRLETTALKHHEELFLASEFQNLEHVSNKLPDDANVAHLKSTFLRTTDAEAFGKTFLVYL